MVAKKTYKREDRSEERRDFDQFYHDMLKPLTSVANKRQLRRKEEKNMVQQAKADFAKGKAERKAYYSKMQNTYTRQTRKLSEVGHTYRKNMLDEEPTFEPRICKKSKHLHRASSTGNIMLDLYNQALEKRKEAVFKHNESVMSMKASTYSSVLHNAGISVGTITNSDKYFATRLQKEFLEITNELEVDVRGTMDKSQFFEIFVRLGLLKPIQELTSEFLARENIRIFDKMCEKIATEEDENIFEVEKVR